MVAAMMIGSPRRRLDLADRPVLQKALGNGEPVGQSFGSARRVVNADLGGPGLRHGAVASSRSGPRH
jgi:hypothetical protein